MSDDVQAVLAANQAFYDAFAGGDMRAMSDIWAAAAPVACVHPGAPLLVGRATVLESWASILEAPERPNIECFQPVAHMIGNAAFVTCYERLGGAQGAVLLATNVFAKEGERWRIVHHHASPTPVSPPRPRAPAPDHVLH